MVYTALDQPLGELPSGITVNLGNPLAILTSGEQAQLSFNVSADNSAEPIGTLVVKVISDEIPIGSVIVNYQFSEANPALFHSPSFIETGVNLDSSVTETITLENKGLDDLNNLKIQLLKTDGSPAPAWNFITSSTNLGKLAIGEKREIQIMASPSTSVSEGVYELILRVTSDNHATVDIYIFIVVTQSGQGNILFKTSDIFTATLDAQGNVIEGLAGTTIQIQNEKVLTINQTLTTNLVGEALLENLPTGRYKFKATAPNHQEISGRFQIKPGITVSERVFLYSNLVTIEWSLGVRSFKS